jgi:outer membrane receptor protein involved in Fe transport
MMTIRHLPSRRSVGRVQGLLSAAARLAAAAAFCAYLPGPAAVAQEAGDEAPPAQAAPTLPAPTSTAPAQATPTKHKKRTPTTDPQLRKREELVVTATRTEQAAGEVPVSVTVVPREELEESPTRTLDDSLRTVVGLNLPLGNSNLIQPTTNNISMRGLGGNRALVLLDGVPQNDAAAGYIHWNKMPLDAVERVEVARGAASSLFGNYAMGGVVNIITRSLEPGRVAADASYGSFNTTRFGASAADSLGKGVDLGVFANYENTDGYNRTLPEERGAIDIPSSSRTVNVLAKLDYKTPTGFEAFLKGDVADQDTGQGTPLSNNTQRIYDMAAGTTVPLGGSTLTANAFYQQMAYALYGTLLVPGTGRDEEYQSSYTEQPEWDVGGSAQWSMPLMGAVRYFTFGVDVRRVSSQSTTDRYDVSGTPTGSSASEGHQLFGGLFGEASWFPDPRFEILLSARLDAWQNAGGHEQNSSGKDTTYEDQSTTRFDPRLSLRWALSEAVALRGAAYRAFHAPSLRDLYRSSTQRSLQIIANPYLGPETLVGGDVGVDVKIGLFTGQVNLFYNNVDGLIVRNALATTPILVVTPRNLGTARAAGVEFIGTFGLSRTLSLDVGYAYNDSVVTDNPSDPTIVGKQLPDVPRHSGSLALSWNPSWGLTLTFRGRGQSERYGDDANLLSMDQHYIFDFYLSYPVLKGLTLFVSGENIFNYQYISEVNIGRRLGQPQAFFGGLRFQLPLASPGTAAPTVR